MTNEDLEPEYIEWRDSKVPHLKVMSGGKGPPYTPTTDWLSELPLGTTFVAQPTSSTAEMNLYHVAFKALPECVLLTWRLPDGKMLDMYFNPEGFCRLHKNHRILGTTPVEEEENDDVERD